MAETTTNAGEAGQLKVRLVTPDRMLLDETADAVELPSASGYLEALYGHAPLLAELGAGEVRLHGGSSGDKTFFVAWGFVEILPEQVTILAETAHVPSEIDRSKAESELQAAEKMWQEAGDNPHAYEDANELRQKAEAEISSSEGKSS